VRKASRRKSKPRPNPHRSISERRRKNRRPGKTPAAPTAKPFKSSAPAPTISRMVDITLRRPAHCRHRRLGFRQIHARQTTFFIAAPRAKTLFAPPKRPPRTAKLLAPSTSTKSSKSIKPLSSAHAALDPALHRRLRSIRDLFCHASGIARTRLPPGRFSFTSRAAAAKPARGWLRPHSNEFSSRRLCDV